MDSAKPTPGPSEEPGPGPIALRALQEELLDKARRVVDDVERRLKHVLEVWPELQDGTSGEKGSDQPPE